MSYKKTCCNCTQSIQCSWSKPIFGTLTVIGWRFVIHRCVDGFSRTVVYLKCANNNLAKIALDGVANFGLPLRVGGDRGVKNVDVARFSDNEQRNKQGKFYCREERTQHKD